MKRTTIVVFLPGLAGLIAVYLLIIDGGGSSGRPTEGEPINAERNLYAGEPWDGKGRGNLTQREAKAFEKADIYWLGPSHGGFHLQGISYISQTDESSLIYGSCRLQRRGTEASCPIPMSITIRSACFVRPEQALQGGSGGQVVETLREGALLLRSRGYGQGTLVWTGASVVSLIAPPDFSPEQLDTLLHDLTRLNRGGGQPGDPLPPPDFSSCG